MRLLDVPDEGADNLRPSRAEQCECICECDARIVRWMTGVDAHRLERALNPEVIGHAGADSTTSIWTSPAAGR